MSYYRNQLEAWLSEISVNAERVLDLGGASNPVRNRVKRFETDECFFMDNGAEEAKVDYLPFDINKPITEQFWGYNIDSSFWNKFDALFCLEVFEYVWNPVQAIQNIYDFMSDDSVCYVSFPAIYPVHNPVNIDYLRYTKEAILHYYKMVGLTHIEITPRVATKGRQDLARFYSNEGMHPVRNSELPYDIGYMVRARKLNL